METTKVIYGSYKEEEIDIIRELFDKRGVQYEINWHRTNRGLPFYQLTSDCEISVFLEIREELNKLIRRKWNWGRMNFRETV